VSAVYLDIPESVSGGVYVTAAEVYDVIHSSHLHCCWEVRRDGELQPCGKEAVAIRFDENNGGLGEVCKHHAKRVLVPLTFIAEVAATSIPPSELTAGPPDYWCHVCNRGAEGCHHSLAERLSASSDRDMTHES